MRKIVYCLLPFLLACSGQDENSNSIDFEDFAGETGAEEIDSTALLVDTLIDLSTREGRLVHALSSVYDTIVNDDFNSLDRFTFSQSKKLGFKSKHEVPYGKSNKVFPTAKVFYYSFKDTTTTKNAFYNYLDGLSANGEAGAVKINQDMEAIKSPPLLLIVYDTVILSAEYMCEHAKNDWRPFEDSLMNIYGQTYRHKVTIDCGGPLKWHD